MTPSSSEGAVMAGDVSGVWQGRYSSNKVPDPMRVVLMFQQLTAQEFEESPLRTGPSTDPGEAVVGVYKGENGAIGTMVGSIDGENVTLQATQTTPTCPGSFELRGIVQGDDFTWQFHGRDCLGDEDGKGAAQRS
jgi:hypothetical protein